MSEPICANLDPPNLSQQNYSQIFSANVKNWKHWDKDYTHSFSYQIVDISVNKSNLQFVRVKKSTFLQLFNMPISCKMPNCKRQDSEAMFTFPTKAFALNNWRLAAKIPENQAVSSYRVCYQHFPQENLQATIVYSLKDKDGKWPKWFFMSSLSLIHGWACDQSKSKFRASLSKCIKIADFESLDLPTWFHE